MTSVIQKKYKGIYFDLIVLVLIGVFISISVFLKVPFGKPTPVYYDDAQALVNGLKHSDYFVPFGYTAFLFYLMKLAGNGGIILGQAFLYITTILLSYFSLRILEVTRKFSLVGAIVVAIHPYLIFNIKRIIDNNLSVPLLLGFILCIILILKYGCNYISLFFLGTLAGSMLLVRPNFLTVLLLSLVTLVNKRNRKLHLWVFAILIATMTIITVTVPLTGKIFILPNNGAYNLFVGANEFTADALINNLDVEPSLDRALKANGIDVASVDVKGPSMVPIYRELGLNYIKNHPVQYFNLCVLRVYTMFRPDYRLVSSSSTGLNLIVMIIIQTIVALPFLLWLITRLYCYSYVGILQGIMSIPVMVLYVFPLALLSANPRLRLTLDIVLILDIVYCWYIIKHKNPILKKVNLRS